MICLDFILSHDFLSPLYATLEPLFMFLGLIHLLNLFPLSLSVCGEVFLWWKLYFLILELKGLYMIDAIYIINLSVVAFDCLKIHITTSFDLFFLLSAPLQL